MYITLFFTILPTLYILNLCVKWRRNIIKAKRCGIEPVTIGPIHLGVPIWQVLERAVIPLLQLLPDSWTESWIDVVAGQWGYHSGGFAPFEKRKSDIIINASPGGHYLSFANAEAIVQIGERRNDFTKPTEVYKILEIWGPNVVTTEGHTWRQQRKVTGPAFSERNNALVWRESLGQVEGLLKKWSGMEGNSPDAMTLKNVHPDLADLSLHVISAAGFGIKLSWSGNDASATKQEMSEGLARFTSQTPLDGHKMTFKNALKGVLKHFLWFAVFDPMTMGKWGERVPIQATNEAAASYKETTRYWEELVDEKVRLLRSGEADVENADLLVRMIEDAGILSNDAKSGIITRQEVIANTWVIMFAGHETTANTLQYILILLALSPSSQARLHADLDALLPSTKPMTEWSYKADCDRLLSSTLGAIINEQLRLIPAVIAIPKQVKPGAGDQTLTVDGRKVVVPDGSFVHMNAYSVHRNPRYWPHGPSKRTAAQTDLNDFVPGRWLPGAYAARHEAHEPATQPGETKLFTPPHGAYIPFSEGARACLGRRFALVEVVAVLAAILSRYRVELAVEEWASEGEMARMTKGQKAEVYKNAEIKAWESLDRGLESLATLQLPSARAVGVRLVRREVV